jgi:predicted dehydrogenase
MGKWHADAVRKVGGVVALVTDADPSRAQALASDVGAASTGSLAAALSIELVDVIHVCTPPSDHYATVRSALLAGLHVICEKPMAETAATTAELYAAARQRDVLLCPAHQYAFQDGMMRVLRRLPALGRLTTVSCVISTAGSDGGDDAAMDKLSIDVLPHPLSLVARIIPRSLANTRWNVTRARSGEMQVIGTHAGVSLSIQISTHGRPTINTLRLTGERGTANVDLFHGFAAFDDVDASRLGKIIHPFAASGRTLTAATGNLLRRASRREPAFPGLRELVRRFYAAVRAKDSSPVEVDESLDVAAARDTIIAAFRAEGSLA